MFSVFIRLSQRNVRNSVMLEESRKLLEPFNETHTVAFLMSAC